MVRIRKICCRFFQKKVDQIVLSMELGMKEKSLVKICPRSDLEERKIYREIVCDIGKKCSLLASQ